MEPREAFDTLFVLCTDLIYIREVKVKAALPLELPVKPWPPQL